MTREAHELEVVQAALEFLEANASARAKGWTSKLEAELRLLEITKAYRDSGHCRYSY